MNFRQKGDFGEQLACAYLEEQGYTISECNFNTKHGEIDIIAENDKETLFAEVKTRSARNQVSSDGEDLPPEKLERMQKAIDLYLDEHPKKTWRPVLLCVELNSGVAQIRFVEL